MTNSKFQSNDDYIEANENIGKKDFFLRLKIARKEKKQSIG